MVKKTDKETEKILAERMGWQAYHAMVYKQDIAELRQQWVRASDNPKHRALIKEQGKIAVAELERLRYRANLDIRRYCDGQITKKQFMFRWSGYTTVFGGGVDKVRVNPLIFGAVRYKYEGIEAVEGEYYVL